jgi:histidinol-phosphate aminotransferase
VGEEENMGHAINRRQWLKTSALAVAGLMTGPSLATCKKEGSIPQDKPEIDDLIRLNNNESPFGISQYAQEAITGSIDLSNRYPHGFYSRLKELIAERENITPDHIILGAGSTEVMVTLIHFAKTNGDILVGDPTYFDFIYYAVRSECSLNKVRLNAKLEHDLEAMAKRISQKTSMVYICNPINPTGSITPKHKLQPFCEYASNQSLVVVDEAYHEYVEDDAYSSMVGLVEQGKNVIVTRTFSKIFGLAGLRIGYGIAHPEIIAKLNKMSRNFAPVAWLSLKAAIASYEDRAFLQAVKEKNKQVKRYLVGELEKLGLSCIASHTNFVLFEVNQDSADLAKKLELQKILVRPFGFHDKQWIRVSCGTKEESRAFISSLTAFL